MAKLFVWIKGFQGPEAQIWPNGIPVDGSNKPTYVVYSQQEIPENDTRTINELIKEHPCPKIENND